MKINAYPTGVNIDMDTRGNPGPKGSLVDESKARFDFSHGKALTTDELEEVEALVNGVIEKDDPVQRALVPLEEAMKIESLRAVFGENYPDPVRVVSVGQPVSTLLAAPGDAQWGNYSVEFCGGTHLSNSSEAKKFALLEESGLVLAGGRCCC